MADTPTADAPAPTVTTATKRRRQSLPKVTVPDGPIPESPITSIEWVDIDSIQTHPDNARESDIEAIRASLRYHGQYKPVLVQASSRYALAGNHTLIALREEGEKKVAIQVLDVDDQEALEILAIDNATSDRGGYDKDTLAKLLQRMPSIERAGYAKSDLDRLLERQKDAAEGVGGTQVAFTTGFSVLITCRDEEHQRELLEKFAAEGLEVKALVS